MDVFLVDLEYNYTQNHSEYGTLKGGFAFAFVYTEESRTAIGLVENALKVIDLNLKSIDGVFPYSGESGVDADTEEQFIELAKTAKVNGTVEFADFYAYESVE